MGLKKIANKWLKKAWVLQHYLKQEIWANNGPTRYLMYFLFLFLFLFSKKKNQKESSGSLQSLEKAKEEESTLS
jgi:hypothetical protein